MKRSAYLLLLGAAVAVPAVLAGCQHAHHRARVSSRDVVPPLASAPVMASPYAAVHTPQYISSLPVEKPTVVETADLKSLPTSLPVQPVAVRDTEASPRMPGYGLQPRNFGDQRRTFGDITARPGFGHAPDHSWLTGELDYLHSRQVWRVRYASVDEDDRYGGSVTLVETGPMPNLQAGQMVRVRGRVVDPETRETCPAYRVNLIEPLEGQ